jgi:hypothetical protein
MGELSKGFRAKKEGENDSNVLRSKFHKQVYNIMGYIPYHSLTNPCAHACSLLCCESLHLRLFRVGIDSEKLCRLCHGLSPFIEPRRFILLSGHEVTK